MLAVDSSFIPQGGIHSIFWTLAVMTTKSNNFKWIFLANARNDSALLGFMGRKARAAVLSLSPFSHPKKKVVIPNPEDSG
jgi:hypothetical protein